jgi:hypothetical protein
LGLEKFTVEVVRELSPTQAVMADHRINKQQDSRLRVATDQIQLSC